MASAIVLGAALSAVGLIGYLGTGRISVSTDATAWVASNRSEYRRYPGLRDEIDSHLGDTQ